MIVRTFPRSIFHPGSMDLAAVSWIAFFGLIAGAWFALYLMAAALADPASAAAWTPTVLISLCRAGADTSAAGWAAAFAMWALMALAMMAPTAVPLLKAWREIAQARPDRIGGGDFWALIGGYLTLWLVFAAVAAAMQVGLADLSALTPAFRLDDNGAAAAVLAVAGLYQFSPFKAGSLIQCRAPMNFLVAHWRPGASAAYRIGLRHGAECLTCCWALMLLGFAAGVMNLMWMGLATGLMVVEKLPDLGRYVTWPLGLGLLGSAAAIVLQTY